MSLNTYLADFDNGKDDHIWADLPQCDTLHHSKLDQYVIIPPFTESSQGESVDIFFTDISISSCVFVQKLRPRGLELQQEELGDMVEQEMSATSAAVESAAARIEVCEECV